MQAGFFDTVPEYWLVSMGFMQVTASPAVARTETGIAASGSRGSSLAGTEANNAAPNRARRTIEMTANEPQCESFSILRFVSRSRRDNTASQTSMNPSR